MNNAKAKIIANIAAVIAGVQVPMSIGGPTILGAAYKPLCELRTQLNLQGWTMPEEVEKALKDKLELKSP